MKTIIIALLVMLSAYTTYYWIQDEGWKDWGGPIMEKVNELKNIIINVLKDKNYGVTRDAAGEYHITLPPLDA